MSDPLENEQFSVVSEAFLKGVETRADSIRKQVEAGIHLVPSVDPAAVWLKELSMAASSLADLSTDVRKVLADNAEAERVMLEAMNLQREAELAQEGE